MRKRAEGDRYRPIVTVHKVKKGIPTVIEVSGHKYQLQHPDHYKKRNHPDHFKKGAYNGEKIKG